MNRPLGETPGSEDGKDITVDGYVPVAETNLHRNPPEGTQNVGESTAGKSSFSRTLRSFFEKRPERFEDVRLWLHQAHRGQLYDQYLARSVIYSVSSWVIGAVIGVLLTIRLSNGSVILSVDSPIYISQTISTVPVGLAITILGSTGVAGFVWFGRYYYPRILADIRRRNIDIVLPHAIVYMYILSRGGLTPFEVIKETSKSTTIYGEVAAELDLIVRDVELFDTDLFTAIRIRRNQTPSDNLRQFLDDVLGALDSGSDLCSCLQRTSETYTQKARAEQDAFLDTLEILSEVFIVAFVAAPLFLIITLLTMGLLGGETLLQLYLLVYLGLPLGTAGFVVVVSILSKPYAQTGDVLASGEDEASHLHSEVLADDPRVDSYRTNIRRYRLRKTLRDPLGWLMRWNPTRSLVLTGPIATLAVVALILSGTIPSTWTRLTQVPLYTTVGLVVVPFLITGIPLSILHETKQRRRRRIARRFPDVLDLLADTNGMDVPFTRSLELVSQSSTGVVARELRKVRNDIMWNEDTEQALLSFANRLAVPQVTRTVKLLVKGNYLSGDVSDILTIAAEDTRKRHQLERVRRREMFAYVVIFLIGFLVYLAVFGLLELNYLDRIGQITPAQSGELEGEVLNVAPVPVDTFRTLFLHSALIQAIGSGLLAGKLADDDLRSGLKYSLVLVGLTVTVFYYVV